MVSTTAFGPQGPNYALTRPPADPKASAGVDTWFKNCSAAGAKDGTFATADFFNVSLANYRYLCRTAGVALDDADDTMIYQAVRKLGTPFYAPDTGSANTIVVSLPGVTAIYEGMVVLAKIAFTNTGPSTLNVNTLGAVSVVHSDSSAMNSGDVVSGGIACFVYSGTVWQLAWQNKQPGAPVYLQGARTYYVNAATGSDTYDGTAATTAGGHGPFATLQHAADVINTFNLNGFSITVNIADGSYASFVMPSPGGSGSVNWVGNAATPGNVVITGVDRTAIIGNNTGVQTINGVKVTSSGNPLTNQDPLQGIAIAYASAVGLYNIEYGACSGYQLACTRAASCSLFGAQKISGSSTGNALSGGGFASGNISGFILTNSLNPPSMTISAAVNLTTFVSAAANATVSILFSSITGAGNVTGTKYLATVNGVILVNGAGVNYYPGTIAGSSSTGQYA